MESRESCSAADGRAWKVDGRAQALVGPGLATPLRGITGLATGGASNTNVITDFTFQPYGSWSEGEVTFRGGRELRECGLVSSGSARAKVSYIPSKKDR